MPSSRVDRLVESRDVGPVDAAGDPRQLLLARKARALHRLPQVADDRQARLAVADHEQVDEGREQLRVLRPGPAGDHQRVVRAAVLGVKRDAAQVEHRQHVRVADLVLERKAQHVEPAKRRERLETVERQPVLAERRLEIRQRRERPLAGPARLVHQAVEHLEPVVAHAQGIGVGKRQADGSARGPVVLGDAVQLAADVLRGGSNGGQDPRDDFVLQFLVQHRVLTPARVPTGPCHRRA